MIAIKKVKTEKKCNRVKCQYFNSLTIKCIFCEWNPDAVLFVKKED